ncbi:UL16 [anatid alphaherpesvirus 1]|nr:UL16 [Anatid alphaherpesvirus 1]
MARSTITRRLSSCTELDDGELNSPILFLNDPSLGSVHLALALNTQVCSWRLIRSDSRIKIMIAITALGDRLCAFAPPLEDRERAAMVEIILYLTRPKALALPSGTFHAVFIVNRSSMYAAIAAIHIEALNQSGTLFSLLFSSVETTPPPPEVPDPSTEIMPQAPASILNLEDHTENITPPRDPHNCRMVSVGAWWSFPKRRLYYLRMDTPLLAICPAGWKARTLGDVLARLVDHTPGCETCISGHDHVDSYNAIWKPGEVAEACLCKGPCLWLKSKQRDMIVEGDVSMCRVLFMDAVDTIRLVSNRNPRISANLAEVISAFGSARQVPVNAAGWHLVALSEIASSIMISGCARLRRLCYPKT